VILIKERDDLGEYSVVFIIGVIIGSFLNMLIYRLPLSISIINPPRSFCTNCKQTLKWHHNIPLISYIFLKQKCAYCNEKIDISYFLVEFISGIIFLILYFKFGFGYEFILYIILFSLLIVLSVIDLKYHAVPDYLLMIVLVTACLVPYFDFYYMLLFSGGFVLLNFVVTFYIQNIKSKILKDDNLKNIQALGEGDIPIVALIGGILSTKAFIAIFLSAIFAIIPSVYNHFFKKQIETPFIPFLSLGLFVELIVK
jgi:leader peptidase (prepilin peptidase)/N-methyltransferase